MASGPGGIHPTGRGAGGRGLAGRSGYIAPDPGKSPGGGLEMERCVTTAHNREKLTNGAMPCESCLAGSTAKSFPGRLYLCTPDGSKSWVVGNLEAQDPPVNESFTTPDGSGVVSGARIRASGWHDSEVPSRMTAGSLPWPGWLFTPIWPSWARDDLVGNKQSEARARFSPGRARGTSGRRCGCDILPGFPGPGPGC